MKGMKNYEEKEHVDCDYGAGALCAACRPGGICRGRGGYGGNGGEITPTPTPSAAPSAEPSTAPTAEPSSKTGSSSGKKPTATAVPSSAQAAPAAASPKTGDGSHAEVWSALTLLCMAGLFLGLRKAKRN